MNKTNKAMLILVLRTVKNISVPGLAISQNYLFILINEIKPKRYERLTSHFFISFWWNLVCLVLSLGMIITATYLPK